MIAESFRNHNAIRKSRNRQLGAILQCDSLPALQPVSIQKGSIRGEQVRHIIAIHAPLNSGMLPTDGIPRKSDICLGPAFPQDQVVLIEVDVLTPFFLQADQRRTLMTEISCSFRSLRPLGTL